MNYRFQKITTVYPEFADQFMASQPDHSSLPYQELHDRFIEKRYGWSDYYARHLRALGNDAEEVFASLEPLQKAWARESGTRYSQRDWLKEIVLAQVRAFQPDVIFLQDLYVLDGAFRRLLREALDKTILIIGFRSAPTDDYALFKDLDLAMACVPNFVEAMRRHGARAEMLLHAFEPSILEVLGQEAPRDFDFTFVGSLIRREGFHRQRYELVESLMSATPLEVWGKVSEGELPTRGPRAMARASYYANRALETVSLPQALRGPVRSFLLGPDPLPTALENSFGPRFHPAVFGLDNFRVLARSKVTFNSHIDCAGSDAGNIRLFEGTGTGACLITDWKTNLPKLFKPDVEVIAYKSAEECAEKVNYLLDHPAEYQKIGAAGQRRALRDHTFAQRAEWLDAVIRKLLSEKAA